MVVRASSFENRSNLAPQFLKEVISRYEGTRLGRQEIYAEVLEDSEGALWSSGQLEKIQVKETPDMARVVVGVDPSKGKERGNDEQGIVCCGQGVDGFYYVIEDASCKLSPEGWAGRAVDVARRRGASCIVVERNAGGDMAKAVIEQAARARDLNVRVKPVLAKSGKGARAEPIAALYEQNKVRHLPGLEKLEDEMCHLTPGGYEGAGSPNRIDGMTWAMLELANVKVVAGEIDEKLEEWTARK